MNGLQKWFWQQLSQRDRQRRVKVWNDLGIADLCLPQETVDLLATQDDIPPFWKSVLLSISDRTGALVQTEAIIFNALSLSLRDTHPDASHKEIVAMIKDLLQRAELETQKLDLEHLLQR